MEEENEKEKEEINKNRTEGQVGRQIRKRKNREDRNTEQG